MSKSFVLKRSGTGLNKSTKEIKVKNLGWLLRHWKEISSLRFNYAPLNMCDGQLVGRMKDGSVYFSDFACFHVCWNFLNRSIFKGLEFTVTWDDEKRNLQSKNFVVGDETYNRINKFDWKQHQFFLDMIFSAN
jgi:hypothetical protein